MSAPHLTSNSVELFLKSWRVYQEIIAHNYMFHHEISAAVRTIFSDLNPNQSLHVLDLGCGDASMALPLLECGRVASYVGCDLSQPALDIAHKQLDLQKITHKLICEDMLRVAKEQPTASFDVVFSSYAIHHLNAIDKQRMIAEIGRILSPGGYFVLIDIFREPREDRPAYMRHYMGDVQAKWTKLSQESRDLVVNHATEYDYPEHPMFYNIQCSKVGFAPGQQLAKHTWHEAWVFLLDPIATR